MLQNPHDKVGDIGLIPGLGRSPGEGHGNPLYYSCLENSVDRGAWRATVHGVAKNRTRLSWLSTHTQTRALHMISSPLVIKWKLSLLAYTDSAPAWPHRYLSLTTLPWTTNLHETKGNDHRSIDFHFCCTLQYQPEKVPGLRQACVAHNVPPDPLSKFFINPKACVAQLRFNAVK